MEDKLRVDLLLILQVHLTLSYEAYFVGETRVIFVMPGDQKQAFLSRATVLV
jgi:hypothetical protein